MCNCIRSMEPRTINMCAAINCIYGHGVLCINCIYRIKVWIRLHFLCLCALLELAASLCRDRAISSEEIFKSGCYVLPRLSDQRPSPTEAHGLLFGSFLPNRSPWASIWCKHCSKLLEKLLNKSPWATTQKVLML